MLAMLALFLSPPLAAQPPVPGGEKARAELIPSVGHANMVIALAYSPDGRFLASVGRDRAGRIWQGSTGILLRTLTGVDSPLLAVAFSADSHIVFTAAQNGSVQWWSAETGKRIGGTAPGAAVTAIALRPTGAAGEPLLVAAAHPDRSITVARIKSLGSPAESMPVLKGHALEVTALQFSPDGKVLASGGQDGLLKTWDIEDGLLRYDMKSHAMPIRGLAFSPDGNTLADASDDGDTNRWDVRTGKLIGSRLQLNSPGDGVAAVAFGPNGNTMATGGRRSTSDKQAYAVLWDAGVEKMTQSLIGHTGYVTALAFSPDGKRLASGSMDHTVRIWNAATGKQIVTSGAYAGVTAVALSSAAPLLASGSTDSAVRIWSTETGELLHILRGHLGAVNRVSFVPDGSQIISGGKDGTIRWWDPATGTALKTIEAKNGEVRALCLSPDGSVVATGHRVTSLQGAIELHDRATGDLIKVFSFTGLRPIDSLSFSPDGTVIASGGGSRIEAYSEVCLWDVKSGMQIASKRPENTASITALAFSPNGKFLATANDKTLRFDEPRETFTGEIQIWNGQTLTLQRKIALPVPETWANALTFLADNQTLLSGGEDGVLRRWNARTGDPEAPYPSQHLGPVAAFTLSATGAILASAGADNTIRLWDAKSGDLLLTQATLPVPTIAANAAEAAPSTDWLAATPDGYYDGSANASRQIQWRVGPDLFPLDSFEALRHKPDVLKRRLSPRRTPPEIKATTAEGPDSVAPAPPMPVAPRIEAAPILSPPQVTFLEPAAGARIDGDTVKVSGWVSDADEISSIALQVNGRDLKDKHLTIGVKHLTIGVKHLTIGVKDVSLDMKPTPADHKFYQTFEGEIKLPASDGEVVITAIAEAKSHLTGREEIRLQRSAAAEKGTLYVLAVGVSKYKNAAYNLRYARSDAEAFAGMWKQQAGTLYKDVRVTELTDERATANNIRAALFKLAEQATGRDCVAIFLSGHGVQDGDKYYFASQEIEGVRDRLDATALPWSALQLTLSAIQARRVVLFLDACHSGDALGKNALAGMQANSDRIAEALVKRAGVMVFSSSRGSEFSYELDDVMHGAFTQALLEGIGQSKANLEIAGQKADSISAEDLLAYLRHRVPQLTGNRQTPSCPLIRDFGDAFPLAQVR